MDIHFLSALTDKRSEVQLWSLSVDFVKGVYIAFGIFIPFCLHHSVCFYFSLTWLHFLVFIDSPPPPQHNFLLTCSNPFRKKARCKWSVHLISEPLGLGSALREVTFWWGTWRSVSEPWRYHSPPVSSLQNGVVKQWYLSDGIMRTEWDGKCKALSIVAGV